MAADTPMAENGTDGYAACSISMAEERQVSGFDEISSF